MFPQQLRALLNLFFFLTLLNFPVEAQTVQQIYEQAVDAYDKKDYERSKSLFEAVLTQYPAFAPAYAGLGYLVLASQPTDSAGAMYYFHQAVKADPNFVNAWLHLGRIYYDRMDFNNAKEAFLKALAIDQSLTMARLYLSWIYLISEANPKAAIKQLEQVPDDLIQGQVLFALGMAYFANNQRVETLDIVTRLKQKNQLDYAQRIELMMRQNKRVYSVEDFLEDPNKVQLPAQNYNQQTVEQSPEHGYPAHDAPAQASSAADQYAPSTGVKVRLRQRLDSPHLN